MEHKVFILLGTNLDDRKANLAKAQKLIQERVGNVLAVSGIYETAPWGYIHQPDFLNQVIKIKTDVEPAYLLKILLAIELEMGRKRQIKWGERIIDLDILFYDNAVISVPNLTIPHPGIPSRRFTLVPLHEIAPDFVHPVLKVTITDLLTSCTDPSSVKAFF